MRVFTAVLLVTACSLAACHPSAPESAVPESSDVTAATRPAAGSQAPVQDPQPTPTVSSVPPPPLHAVSEAAPADEFAGWYVEKNGTAMLQACGQSMPLEVADPAFLRQLRAKRGGTAAPIYVQLAVRPAAGAKLEVAEVRMFGVDEGPAPNCPSIAAR